jgi:hypothetical protein
MSVDGLTRSLLAHTLVSIVAGNWPLERKG